MTDAPLRKALNEVFQGHKWIDFDWNGWRERARHALATPPVVVTADDEFVPQPPTRNPQ